MADRLNWVKIADSIEEISFAPNNIAAVNTTEKSFCIGRHNGELFAFARKCPHAGGYFAGGHIDPPGNVVCPIHRYKFCMKNGCNVSGEGYYLKHWPVEVRENGVYVGLEANRIFGLF